MEKGQLAIRRLSRPCRSRGFRVFQSSLLILDPPKVPCFLEVFCYIKPTKKHGTFGGPGRFALRKAGEFTSKPLGR